MERNFTPDDFEHFLRQNADGLRMRPSDRVWEGISQKMNGRRRRWGLLLLALLAGTAGGYHLLPPDSGGIAAQTGLPADGSGSAAEEPTAPYRQGSDGSTNRENRTPASGGARVVALNTYRNEANPRSQTSSSRSFDASAASLGTLFAGIAAEDRNGTVPVRPIFEGTVVDAWEPDAKAPAAEAIRSAPLAAVDPLTIESVVNLFGRSRQRKLGFQLYLTPTVSYRKLSDNKDYLNPNSGLIPAWSNVNNAVTHKPDFGMELGLAAKYPIARNVKLRAGVQFNVTRYEIKTYHTSTQLATIRLNTNRGGLDSMNAITNYNNYSGYKSNWLENLYFQVSAPVGVEMMLKGDEKMQFGIAGTVQPTYVLRDRVYLLSTDYKNYAEVPALVRRWNMNTSLETFVAYSTGKLKWQVGPQVRYQVLSSYKKKYPVKEHLFDFGLKMGVSLNKR